MRACWVGLKGQQRGQTHPQSFCVARKLRNSTRKEEEEEKYAVKTCVTCKT